jgi:hypothetical protein
VTEEEQQGFDWLKCEEKVCCIYSSFLSWVNISLQHMFNNFSNDNACISAKWLLRQIHSRGLTIEHLLRIRRRGVNAQGNAIGQAHILVILPGGGYVCDCCMGLNLGIPCRHYFQALSVMKGLRFSISLIRPRYFSVYCTEFPPNTCISGGYRIPT